MDFYAASAPLWVPFAIWAAIEAARVRSGRWVVTILLLSPPASLAWFIGGRRQYGYGRGPAR